MNSGNGHQTMRVAVPTAELPAQQRSARVDELVRRVAELGSQVHALASVGDDRWVSASETHKRIGDRHHAFVSMPFFARLRWLLTGR